MQVARRAIWSVIVTVVWLMLGVRCLPRWFRKFSRPGKNVLFCVSNELMLTYVQRIWSDYFDSSKYRVHLCGGRAPPSRGAVALIISGWKLAAKLRVPYWSAALARRTDWDLVICAMPDDLPTGIDRAIQKLMTGHSLVGFKRYDGFLYPYLPEYLLSPDGAYMFDSFLESSRYKLKQVMADEPRFKDVIDVVGGLPADILLEKNRKHLEIRREMGFGPEDFVILIQSTFGDSLIEDFGDELFVECERMAATCGYKFIISLHPNHWNGIYERTHPFGKMALAHESEAVIVRRPTEDQDPYMIASDMVLTDHTSLGVNYALLGKPMIFYFPGSGNQAVDMLAPLAQLYPTIECPEDIEAGVLEAKSLHDPQKLQNAIDQFVEPGGNARERIDKVLTRLLSRKR